MKRMKLAALLLSAAMLLSIASGCGSQTTTAETVTSETEETVEEASEKSEVSVAEAPEQVQESAAEEASTSEVESLPRDYSSEEHKEYSLWMGLSQFAAAYVDEPATELTLFREINDRLNISFDVTAVNPESLDTNFSLMIAAGDYSDIISEMGNYSLGIEDAINSDIIRDVYDLVEEYAPNYWAQLTSHVSNYMSMVTESGYMGSLCVFLEDDDAASEQWGYITNGAWYDEFGMDIATTVDEFHTYLTKAHDEYGAQFSIGSTGVEAGILSAYNISSDMYVVDGTVHYGYLEDSMKEYYQLMNDWYQEGIIETGFYNGTTDTGAQLAGSANGTFSAWAGTAEVSKNVYSFDDEGHTSVVAGTPYLKMSEDDEIHTLSSVSYISDRGMNAWSFRADLPDEDVITLLNVVDYMFTDEGNLLYNWGVEGEAFEYDANGDPQWTELVTNNPDGMMYNATSYIYASQNGTTYLPGLLDLTKGYYSFTDDQWQALEAFTTCGDSEYTIPRAVTLTTDENQTYTQYQTDIETYVEETTVDWIIGDRVTDAEWDQFVQTLHTMGIDEMIRVYQDAYDRYDAQYEAAEAAIGA
jgi:putative aldouronate transport system substrate-binding protein